MICPLMDTVVTSVICSSSHIVFNMARVFSTLLYLLAIVGLSSGFNLTVLHTNDVHARFEQANKYGGQCSETNAADGKCFGGVARRATKIKQLRAKYPNTVLLDGGDQYSGTLWFYKYGGEGTAHFMNLLGYDVMALGNHEFDRKPQGLIPLLNNVNFTILSCNIDTTGEPSLTGKFAKRHVLSVGGEQIGVVGYTTVETLSISQPGNLVFLDEVSSVRKEVNELMAQGINKIIALGHAGFDIDQKIAKEVNGVDIVVGGHTNTFLYTGTAPSNEKPEGDYPYVVNQSDGKKVLVVQDYAYGKYLGFLQVVFDNEGIVSSWGGNPILLDKAVPQDSDMLAKMEPYRQGVNNESFTVVGRSHVYLEAERDICRQRECNLGNFIADGMIRQNMRHSDSLFWNNVSLAVINSGGIRASIDHGDITIGEVQATLPFSDTIDIVELKGTHLRQVLEYSAHDVYPGAKPLPGRFLQYSGIRVIYDISKPPGQKLVDVKVRCSKCSIPRYGDLDDEEVYQVIMPSFIANGGDGYSVIKKKRIRHHPIGDADTDVAVEYIKRMSPVFHGLEGRITILNGSEPVCVKWSTHTDRNSSSTTDSVSTTRSNQVQCVGKAGKIAYHIDIVLFLLYLSVAFSTGSGILTLSVIR